MNMTTLLESLKDLEKINQSMVDGLYGFTVKIVFILWGAAAVLTYMLYGPLGDAIVYWFVIFTFILFLRLFTVYLYTFHQHQYTLNQWYMTYLFFAFSIAIYVSMLSWLFLAQLSLTYQLVIIIVLLGISSGSTSAFPTNYRLGIVYMLIITLPLLLQLILLGSFLHCAVALLVLLHNIGQVGMIFRNYQHEVEFSSLQSEQEVLHYLFKEAPLGIFIYDDQMNIIECNEQFLTMFEHDKETMIGFNLKHLPDTNAADSLKKALFEGAQIYKGPYLSTKGKRFWIEAKIFPYKNLLNNTIGSVVLIEDKSKEKSIQEELQYIANHDVLTGLLNRRGLRKNMEKLVHDEKHASFYSLLFYVDLNQFKGINDSLGHSVGDAVLLNVSQRLQLVLGHNSDISRLGGDEFIIILPHLSQDKDTLTQYTKKYVEKIQSIFDEPFIIDDLHLHIKASIGIIIIEPRYNNIEEIIRHADITMYHAKNSNSHISYYNESLDQKQKKLFALQHDLAYAIERNQMEIFFQPIVNIADNTLYAAEALIRWTHPDKGLMGPNDFIPLAIEAGLLSNITWWVLDTVCHHIAYWKKIGLWRLHYISINVNAQQLIENNFADEFLQKVKAYGLDNSDILVEITERSLIDNFDSTQSVINKLRQNGVRCAIDDFGIGYSSLSYLKKLSFHTLKIDKEFVKDIEFNRKELLLVSSILSIGREFDYNIVIEGIEDENQKRLLYDLDKELRYQGYLCSKPVDAENFEEQFLVRGGVIVNRR